MNILKKPLKTLLICFVLLFGLSFVSISVQAENGSNSVSGYAWSDNIGWIDFAPAFGGVSINSVSGDFSGYAWSDNIGWIDFAPAGPYPGSPFHGVQEYLESGLISGWAKAVSADGNGWDGWISFSGESPQYNVSIDKDTGSFSGWAWGSDVVGWVDFSGVYCAGCAGLPDPVCGDATCDPSESCSTCEADCGVCVAVCGDGICSPTEDCATCEEDCGVCSAAIDFTLNNSNAIYATLPSGLSTISTETTIRVIPTGTFSNDVVLSSNVATLINGATDTFSDSTLSPSEYTGGTKFKVNVPANTTPGLYTVTITGLGGGLNRTVNVSLNIEAVDQGWIEI